MTPQLRGDLKCWSHPKRQYDFRSPLPIFENVFWDSVYDLKLLNGCHCRVVLMFCSQDGTTVELISHWYLHGDHRPKHTRFLCRIKFLPVQIIIIKLYCHIQRALHDELECSLALTHIVPIYTITWNMANKYKIYIICSLKCFLI